MNNRFQKVKNIIFLIASALALVAMTFAWFSVSNNNGLQSAIQKAVAGNLISAKFSEAAAINASGEELETGKTALDLDYTFIGNSDDIKIDTMIPGQQKYYRSDFDITKGEKVSVALSFSNISTTITDELKNNLFVSYQIYKVTRTKVSGGYTDTNNTLINSSSTDVGLSSITAANPTLTIFTGVDLSSYYSADENTTFAVYYQIRLGSDYISSEAVSNLSLGTVKISAINVD